ncbi:hypothetical protein [Micromonospora rubida]|uniref:hypothetical protein n=1 Tax=Micromonospora rubida TaxID=2697657 RepID=UPI0013775F60|nr:hypothetical protein [Micromonospora rubida]NBE79950.1 hypothetical protein [Micromonospora rubida]
MIPTRFRRPRVAVAVAAALALAVTPTGAPPARAAQAAASQVVSFTVGQDGRLYLASPAGITPFGSTVVAPPNAGVAAARQPDGNVAAFVIGTQGGLVAAVTSSATSNISVYRDGAAGLAPPGARVSAVTDSAGYLHVFFAGTDGAIYSASYNRQVRPGGGPQRVSAPGLAPPGAVVAATRQSTMPGVVFVGADGALTSVWRTSAGTWATIPAGPTGMAPPGGGVAVAATAGVQAYVAGLDGRIWQVGFAFGPRPEPWQPVAITGAGAAPAGARLAAAQFTGGPSNVFFAGSDGAVRVVTNMAGGWQQSVTTAAGAAKPGGPLAIVAVDDYLYSAWCGNDLWWWLYWWWRRPPPPPPWWGDPFTLPLTQPIEYGAEVAITLYR